MRVVIINPYVFDRNFLYYRVDWKRPVFRIRKVLNRIWIQAMHHAKSPRKEKYNLFEENINTVGRYISILDKSRSLLKGLGHEIEFQYIDKNE